MNYTTLINNIRDGLTSSSAINDWCRTNYGQAPYIYKGVDLRYPPPQGNYPLLHLFPVSRDVGYEPDQQENGIGLTAGVYDETETTSTVEINKNLRNSTYRWILSSSGTSEYYCELVAGGDPSLNDPDGIELNTVAATEGTLGSLSASEWGYGDNDTLGFSTVYVRLADSTDPDSKASGWVQTADLVNLVEYDGVDLVEELRKLAEDEVISVIDTIKLTDSAFFDKLEIQYEAIEEFPFIYATMKMEFGFPYYTGDDPFA